jgi:hypothetical protein
MKTASIKRNSQKQRRELAAIFASCWWSRAAFIPFNFRFPF